MAPGARNDGRAPAVRLTRRGRLVLLTLLLAVSTALAGLVGAPGLAAEPPAPAPVAVVRPGDTLWSIAVAYAPQRDPFETIDEIRRLNQIEDYTVHPGQRIVLPRRR